MKIYLKDTVQIVHGHNSSRIKNQKNKIYNVDDMVVDLNSMYCLRNLKNDDSKETKGRTKVGQIMFNLNTYQAAVVSEQNASKIIDQNFVQIEIKSKSLDAIYLCYMLNESNTIQRQENAFSQGVVVRRMAPNNILSLSLPDIDIRRQKLIGRIYALKIHESFLRENREKMFNSLMNQVLQNSIEEKENK